MTNLSLIISSVLTVFLGVLVIGLIFLNQASRIKNKRRLSEIMGERRFRIIERKNLLDYLRNEKIDSIIESLHKMSLPEKGWQDSPFIKKFVQAGIRDQSVYKYFFAYKTFFAGLGTIFGFIIFWVFGEASFAKNIFYSLLTGAFGYYIPNLYISYKIKQRSQEMMANLPDFLDLLVICTESGLSVDAAINRVSQEIAKNSKIIGEEFYLTALEIRAGAGRIESLRNLSQRVELDDLRNLVSMSIQADKFGTSFADSLKIQSDLMRTKRMQKAEEMAAKIPVKMLIPLVLCIFPVFLIVILAPLISKMSNVFN